MAILDPSLILLAYRAENGSFVLENSSGVQLKIDEYEEYVNTHSNTISPAHSSVLENATEKTQNDFSTYSLYNSWIDCEKKCHCVILRHSSPWAKDRDNVRSLDWRSFGIDKIIPVKD